MLGCARRVASNFDEETLLAKLHEANSEMLIHGAIQEVTSLEPDVAIFVIELSSA